MNKKWYALKYFDQINSFNDFYELAYRLKTEHPKNYKKIIGDIFEWLPFFLLVLDPEYNRGVEKIWMYDEIPREILEDLNLPTKDEGIDLLALINGEYVPIQAKFRSDKNTKIPWEELSTFAGLSFVTNDIVKKCIFVTNTYTLCDNIANSPKVVSIYGKDFEDIDANIFKNIKRYIRDGKIDKYERKIPKDYQVLCILKCFLYFFCGLSRGFIEVACGAGKTLIAYWLDKKMINTKTVIFVPSLYLLHQIYRSWILQSDSENVDNLTKNYYLLIGSDVDIDDGDILHKPKNIYKTTNTNEIKKFIHKNSGPDKKLIVICTYQSSDKLITACKNFIFDLGIYDECHKTVGQKNKHFGRTLFDSNLKINKRLFMTATPREVLSKNSKVIDMSNKKYYGERFFTFNFGEAIINECLTNYNIVSIVAKNSDIKKFIEENKLVQIKERKFIEEEENENKQKGIKFKKFIDKEANYVGIAIMILKEIKDGRTNHLVTYHNTISHSKKFCDFLKEIHDKLRQNNSEYDFDIYIGTIDGKIKMSQRNKIINTFKESKFSVLCSARVLNEGVDIPIIDSVCFVDRRVSTIDIIQCIGRCMRWYEGKKMAYVYIPTFIDDINDSDDNSFRDIIKIVKAMKMVDVRLVSYFKIVEYGKVQKANSLVSYKYFDDSVNISEQINLNEWEEKISCKIWPDDINNNFNYYYNKLLEWTKTHNRIPTMKSKDQTELILAKWCSKIKSEFNHGELETEYIKKMHAILKKYKCEWSNNKGWEESVKKAIQRRVDTQSGEFTMQQLIKYELDKIVEETDCKGKTPRNTLARVLQILQKKDYIEFIKNKPGHYRLIKKLNNDEVIEV